MSHLIRMAPGLQRLRCQNPSPLTGSGTNTYILGEAELCVIDPGPQDQAHLEALLELHRKDQPITKILVTHSHLDHSPLARDLSKITSAPVFGYGAWDAGRSEVMQSLMTLAPLGGGEGRDIDFQPDILLSDGEKRNHAGEEIEVLWTPGHFGNHLCFAWKNALFSGDLVMGWATSLVSPPDGDLTDFMASCQRLLGRTDLIYYPGHGDPISDPQSRVAELIAHRQKREAQILSALERGQATPRTITERVYTDVSEALWPAAERNVLAHLIDLSRRGGVDHVGTLSADAVFFVT